MAQFTLARNWRTPAPERRGQIDERLVQEAFRLLSNISQDLSMTLLFQACYAIWKNPIPLGG